MLFIIFDINLLNFIYNKNVRIIYIFSPFYKNQLTETRYFFCFVMRGIIFINFFELENWYGMHQICCGLNLKYVNLADTIKTSYIFFFQWLSYIKNIHILYKCIKWKHYNGIKFVFLFKNVYIKYVTFKFLGNMSFL